MRKVGTHIITSLLFGLQSRFGYIRTTQFLTYIVDTPPLPVVLQSEKGTLVVVEFFPWICKLPGMKYVDFVKTPLKKTSQLS